MVSARVDTGQIVTEEGRMHDVAGVVNEAAVRVNSSLGRIVEGTSMPDVSAAVGAARARWGLSLGFLGVSCESAAQALASAAYGYERSEQGMTSSFGELPLGVMR